MAAIEQRSVDGRSTVFAQVADLAQFRTHRQDQRLDICTRSILRTDHSCRFARPVNLIEPSLGCTRYPALNHRQADTETTRHATHRYASPNLCHHRSAT